MTIVSLFNCSIVKLKKRFNHACPVLNGTGETMEQWSNRCGFTLIEILIAIAVVALVMAVLFPNFMGIRQRARDTQRKSDLSQIQKAFELYKTDQNPQVYPAIFPSPGCGGCFSSGSNCTGNIYMRKFPCDPGGAAPTYIYTRGTDDLTYSLSACLENTVDSDRDRAPKPTVAACNSSTGASYTVNEP